ncbi:MAG: hypothetical protein ABSF14_02310 [Terriglobia bacterium]|jgi:hypothetical protein
MSERISHTRFVPILKVKPDEEYIGYMKGSGDGVKAPELYQLLPGEESTGAYRFVVRNGTTPVALILSYFSAGKEHRPSIELAGIVETETSR